MTARTPHRIANDQSQTVRVERPARQATELLPNRHALSPGTGSSARTGAFDPERTIHFPSELHYGLANTSDRRAAVVADWQWLNSQIAHRVIPGDLTHNTLEAEQEGIEAFLLSIDTRDRWDVIGGNHDLYSPGSVFAEWWGYPDRHWTYDLGDYRILGITPEAHGEGTQWLLFSASDLEWLEDALDETEKRCVIVFHAPLKDTTTYGGFPTSEEEYHANPDTEIRAILNAHSNAVMWISGHTHASTADPNIFMLADVGDRSIIHLNCSGIAYVSQVNGGIGNTGPLRSPVVTFADDVIYVRWRDHVDRRWLTFAGLPSGTNLLRNPSAETNTTDAAASSGFTLSRDTGEASVGSASFKVLTDGTGAQAKRLVISSATGLALTGSARPFIGAIDLKGAPGNDVRVDVELRYTDATNQIVTGTLHKLSDNWIRVVSPVVTANAAKTVNQVAISVRVVTAAVFTFFADAAQIEQGMDATSYIDGSLGNDYSWTGTAHASTSVREITLNHESYAEWLAVG